MTDQTENQQNAATVDSCFELIGSRQHGVAQQKVEHQRESSVLPNARGSRFRMGPSPRELRTMDKRTEISWRCEENRKKVDIFLFR